MSTTSLQRASLSATIVLALIFTSAAMAQSETANRDLEGNSYKDEIALLDTVVVTVERREQALQKYAGTAQAFTPEELRLLGINTDLRNLQVAVPGMNIANQEGNLEIFIRGVGSSNNTELGDPAAAPHVNGIYIPRPRGLGTMFYDLERVEVNKGPQGTLRGRNALAGTVNIVTKRPELGGTFGGYVEAEVGSLDTEGLQVALNAPLGDFAALRFAGYSMEKGTSFTNAGQSQHLEPAGIQDEAAGRISFLYEPDDRLSVFAMLDYGHEGGTGYPGANAFRAFEAGFAPDDLDFRDIVYRGPQGELDSTHWGLQGNVTYDLGGITLEYSGSYRDLDYSQTNAASDQVNWMGRDVTSVDYDNFSTTFWETKSGSQVHEVRLFNDDDARLRWTAGLFHFKEEQQVGFFSLNDKGIFYSGTEFTMPDVDGASSAIFADGTFDLHENFRIKGGVRYTEESKSRYGIGGNWTIGLGAANGCCFSVRLGTPGFIPAMTRRPNFDLSGVLTDADRARFLLQGVLAPSMRDTLFTQIGGIANGTVPNGTCVDRADTNGAALDCAPNGQHPWFVLGIPSQQFGESEFDFLDWRTGFEWDITDRSLFYGTVSTGHKAGGFNDTLAGAALPETFDPEMLTALEMGSKNTFGFLGGTSIFNVSGFFYRYDKQVFQDLQALGLDGNGDPSGYTLVNRNVGKSELYGIEMETRLNLPAGFGLDINALYLETEIKDGSVADIRSQNFGEGGVTSVIDLSGNELALSPKLTLNAILRHGFDVGIGSFDWQILASYRSDYYLTQYNGRDVVFVNRTGDVVDTQTAAEAGFPDQQESHTHINVGAGFTSASGRWRVEAYGTNLLNKDVSQKALVGSQLNVRFLNDARAYGMRVRYAF